MGIRLIDKWRNVTLVPTKAVTAWSQALEILDGLLHAQNVSIGQLEFECDREFIALLEVAADPKLNKAVGPWKLGHEMTCDGVPLIVVEG